MNDSTPQPSTTPDAPQTCERCGHAEVYHNRFPSGCQHWDQEGACDCREYVAPTSITPEQPTTMSAERWHELLDYVARLSAHGQSNAVFMTADVRDLLAHIATLQHQLDSLRGGT